MRLESEDFFNGLQLGRLECVEVVWRWWRD